MKRLIEKNKTYRIIDKRTGKTCLFHVREIHNDFVSLEDLSSKKIKKFDRKSFEKRLDAGEIYVSAHLTS